MASCDLLKKIHDAFLEGTKVHFSEHALKRMKERGISREHIEQIFGSGSVIEIAPARIEYPIDCRQRLDKVTCRCYVDGINKILYVIIIYDHDSNEIKFVTIYPESNGGGK